MLFRRMANLFRRSRLDREIEAELKAHLEMRTDENQVAGMTPSEARRDALLRFGNPVSTRERVTAADAHLGVESVLRDLRYSARQLRRSPGFAFTTILILALGVGAVTAIFSAVYPILFEPLPYPHASRIAMVWDTYQGARLEATYGTFRELAARSRSFEAMATFEPWQPGLTGGQTPDRLEGEAVSARYLSVPVLFPRWDEPSKRATIFPTARAW